MRKIHEVRKLLPRRRMRELIESGTTLQEVKCLLNCTTDQIRTVERETKLKLPRDVDKIGNEILTVENMQLWAKKGYTRMKIAELTGLPQQTVGKYAKKNKHLYVIPYAYNARLCKTPERKYSDIEKIALFMPLVSNSQDLRPDHGAAA